MKLCYLGIAKCLIYYLYPLSTSNRNFQIIELQVTGHRRLVNQKTGIIVTKYGGRRMLPRASERPRRQQGALSCPSVPAALYSISPCLSLSVSPSLPPSLGLFFSQTAPSVSPDLQPARAPLFTPNGVWLFINTIFSFCIQS